MSKGMGGRRLELLRIALPQLFEDRALKRVGQVCELSLDAEAEAFLEQAAVVAGRAADVLIVTAIVLVPANGRAVVDQGSAVGVEESLRRDPVRGAGVSRSRRS